MNTRYYLDTEFNSFGGSLISLGMVRHDDPEDTLYMVVPAEDIERMKFEEGMDPWIEKNIIPVLWDIPAGVEPLIIPVHEWGIRISNWMYRGGEVPQVLCDWPSDAMDFCRLLMTGPGQAVQMLNQTHLSILRHIDVYPTTLAGAVQHNAIWDALAIRQLMLELEAKPDRTGQVMCKTCAQWFPADAKAHDCPGLTGKPDPIQSLGRPIKHDQETHAAIQRLGTEFHKTRLSHNVCVDPGDLSLALKALGYYG
jgi:hypothetical protein